MNAFSLWKPGAVRITAGVEHVATFQKTELSQRRYCAKCRGHLMTNHPQIGPRRGLRVDHSDTKIAPGIHINMPKPGTVCQRSRIFRPSLAGPARWSRSSRLLNCPLRLEVLRDRGVSEVDPSFQPMTRLSPTMGVSSVSRSSKRSRNGVLRRTHRHQ